jgi:hypothetical protein
MNMVRSRSERVIAGVAATGVAVAGCMLLSAPNVYGQEKKIARSALPPAVERAVQGQSKGAEIKGFVTEVEHGVRVYEVEMVVDGHTRDVQMAGDGAVMEVEEEVGFASLSPEVQRGLKAKAGEATITKVESLTKKGTLVAYEAATRRGTKKGEVQVGPAGGSLAHPE